MDFNDPKVARVTHLANFGPMAAPFVRELYNNTFREFPLDAGALHARLLKDLPAHVAAEKMKKRPIYQLKSYTEKKLDEVYDDPRCELSNDEERLALVGPFQATFILNPPPPPKSEYYLHQLWHSYSNSAGTRPLDTLIVTPGLTQTSAVRNVPPQELRGATSLVRFFERRGIKTEIPQSLDWDGWKNCHLVVIGSPDDQVIQQWRMKRSNGRKQERKTRSIEVLGTIFRARRDANTECIETVITCTKPEVIESVAEMLTSDLKVRALWSKPRGRLREKFQADFTISRQGSTYSSQFVPNQSVLAPRIEAPRIQPQFDRLEEQCRDAG